MSLAGRDEREGDVAHPRARLTLSRWRILSGSLVLLALSIDLAGTRWGSYLQVPGLPVYLPDLLLILGASLGMRRVLGLPPMAVVASAVLGFFMIFQLLRPGAGPSATAVRDLAPFLYLALVPPLAVALRAVPPALFLRVIRVASAFMAITLAARAAGALQPFSVPLAGIPLFTPRDDAEAVVLAIGLVAYGRWPGVARPFRSVQVLMLALAVAGYSRAGLLAVIVCSAIVLHRERDELLAPRMRTNLAVALAAACVLPLTLILVGFDKSPVEAPQAVARLVTSETSSGTTGARFAAWDLLVRYTAREQQMLLGEGPGTAPVARSGAVRYLSGDLTVRAAHNWLVSALAYFGFVGLLLWTCTVGAFLGYASSAPLRGLVWAGVAGYGSAALFGVLIESPFGSLPLCVLLAWGLAHRGGRAHGPRQSAATAHH